MYYQLFRRFLILFFSVHIVHAFAQKDFPKRPLPNYVNVHGYDVYAPSLNYDGSEMIFVSTYSNTASPAVFYTTRSGSSWSKPQELTFLRSWLKLNDKLGYNLSPDGQTLIITTRKTPTIGGYDIYLSQKVNGKWQQPVNAGKPINSTMDEGFACFSPDGQYLFFSRCAKIDGINSQACRIYYAKKKGKYFSNLKSLDSKVNSGNSAFPFLASDNTTLYYASRTSGNWDIKMAQGKDFAFENSKSLEFFNDNTDDVKVSVPAGGKYIFFDTKMEDSDYVKIYYSNLPENYAPLPILMLKVKVSAGDRLLPDKLMSLTLNNGSNEPLRKIKASEMEIITSGEDKYIKFVSRVDQFFPDIIPLWLSELDESKQETYELFVTEKVAERYVTLPDYIVKSDYDLENKFFLKTYADLLTEFFQRNTDMQLVLLDFEALALMDKALNQERIRLDSIQEFQPTDTTSSEKTELVENKEPESRIEEIKEKEYKTLAGNFRDLMIKNGLPSTYIKVMNAGLENYGVSPAVFDRETKRLPFLFLIKPKNP